MKLLVLVPVLNEGPVIRGVLAGIPDKVRLGRKDVQVDILVIDDGSTDDSAELVLASGRYNLIRHAFNTGAGGATRTGLRYARTKNYDYVVTVDGDGQHDIRDVFACVEYALESGDDLVVGNRLLDANEMPGYKKMGNYLMSRLTGVILGVYVPDSQCGLRVYSKKAIDTLSWDENGYIFCSEMLLHARKLQLKVGSYSIKAIYTDYSKAKGQSSWNAISMVKRILAIRMFGGSRIN